MSSVTNGAKPDLALYRRLPHGHHGLAKTTVVANQRARIFGAMVELVSINGYAGTSLVKVATLAGVSRRTVYDLFATEQERRDGSEECKTKCFLWVFDVIVSQALKRVTTAYRGETDWEQRLQSAFSAFATHVNEQPNEARVAAVEIFGAGPAALARMEEAHRAFGRLIASSFERTPSGAEVPPWIIMGIVGGMARVVRQRLLDGRQDELVAHTNDLVKWALAYCSPAIATIPATASPSLQAQAPGPGLAGLCDDTATILRGAAAIAAEAGYLNVSIAKIAQDTGISDRTILSLYPTAEDCFLAAYDFLGSEIVSVTAAAALTRTDWIESLDAGIRALLSRVAADPVFAKVAFVEVFSAGPRAIRLRSDLMASFTGLLNVSIPEDCRPSPVVIEAIVGAIWQRAHRYVVGDHLQRLPELANQALFFILAPTIGGEQAAGRILSR